VPELGKTIVIAGLSLVALGLLVWAGGKMPGNFTWRWGNMTIYFPLAACLLVSLVGSFILWLMQRR